MSLRGQKTTSDYIKWSELQLLINKLERDKETKFCLLIAMGSYTGLRISDLLSLRWVDVIGQTNLEVIEKKTKKERTIELNPELIELINRLYNNQSKEQYIFINRFGTKAINVQYVNRKLKLICEEYGITGLRISSHTFRKSLGRRIWEKNNHSEQALMLLSQLFNHSSVSTTKIYLGIRSQEISNLYLNL